jgi:hypothetical protein
MNTIPVFLLTCPGREAACRATLESWARTDWADAAPEVVLNEAAAGPVEARIRAGKLALIRRALDTGPITSCSSRTISPSTATSATTSTTGSRWRRARSRRSPAFTTRACGPPPALTERRYSLCIPRPAL